MEGQEDLRFAVDRHEEVVKELVKGQATLRENMIVLTENLKGLGRIEARINRLEARQEQRDKEQDAKIERNTYFMYKVIGVASSITLLIATLGPFIINKLSN